MNALDEHSRSLWMDVEPVRAPALAESLETDVVIVGAGIAGLSTAYELVRAGKRVVVLDRGAIAGGMTARTSAHLAFEMDDYYEALIRLRGEAEARQYFQSQSAAVDRIEQIVHAEGIACDFARVDGYLAVADVGDADLLDREYEACVSVGLNVAWADAAPLEGADTGACLRFPQQARFHPLKYCRALAECVRRHGGLLFADTAVVSVAEEGERVTVTTEAGPVVTAAAAVVASNTPVDAGPNIHTKQAPFRTFVFAARVPKGGAEDILFWDTGEPYHYVRLQPGETEDLLIVGGEDFKTGHHVDVPERFERLEAWARIRWPQMGDVTHRWSGQVFEPADKAPFIGRNGTDRNIFTVTGDSGEGLTTGVAASLILSDLIQGRENPWTDVYNPERKTLKPSAVGEFLKENLDVASQLVGHVTGGEVESTDAIARGEGALVRLNGAKVAAFRDRNGELHLRSAVCTHMGCVVRFNSFEECWDCPCHGSQFSVDGEVLNGPAVRPLEAVEPAGG
ncbi:MAG TPA: FAD-dependent oxidoreductase [Caulobacteraceae bacterium]|jgi:hypothetical protein